MTMQYSCTNCLYITTRYSNLLRHRNKKKACYNGKFQCDICQKKLTTNFNLKRHKISCKSKKKKLKNEIKQPNDNQQPNNANSHNQQPNNTNSPNQQPNNANSPNQQPNNTNSPNQQPNNTNSPNQQPNNTNSPNQQPNNTNSPNQQPNNANSPNNKIIKNINNFGWENISYLQNEKILQTLINEPEKYIELFIQNIHFHPNHPENHNIKIPKKLPNSICIKKGGELIYKNRREVINNLIDIRSIDIKKIFYEHYNDLDLKLRESIHKCLTKKQSGKDKLLTYNNVINMMFTNQDKYNYSSWIK